MANNPSNKPQTVVYADAVNRGACVAHLEAYFGKSEPKYYPEADGKKSRLTLSFTSNTNVWELLGRAEGDPDRYKDRQESHVLFGVAFGTAADRLKDMKKSGRCCLTGKISRNVYKDGSGAEREAVSVTIYSVVPVTSLTDAPEYIAGMKTKTSKGDEQTMLCCVAGEVSYVGELKQGTKDPYFSFSMKTKGDIARAFAVANGAKPGESSNSVSVTVWGRRAEALSKFVAKGMPLIVTGTVTDRENNGKTYYNMSCRGLTLYPKDKGETPAPATAPAAAAPAAANQFANVADIDDDDGELPF